MKTLESDEQKLFKFWSGLGVEIKEWHCLFQILVSGFHYKLNVS